GAAPARASGGGRRGGEARRLARLVDRGPGAGRSHTFSGAGGEDADQGETLSMWIINTALIRPLALALGEGGEQTAPLGRRDRQASGVYAGGADCPAPGLRRFSMQSQPDFGVADPET